MLSVLAIGRLNPPGDISDINFCYRLCLPQGHSATGRIMSMKNSNGTILSQTRDLVARSAVPPCDGDGFTFVIVLYGNSYTSDAC